MNAKQLAQLVIEVLEAQRNYFSSRDKQDLIRSKRLEKKLREAAEFVIHHSREDA